MTLEELKKARSGLVERLAKEVQEFENHTGLQCDFINVYHAPASTTVHISVPLHL